MGTFEDNAELLDVASICFDTFRLESRTLLSYEVSLMTFEELFITSKIYLIVFIDSLIFLDQKKLCASYLNKEQFKNNISNICIYIDNLLQIKYLNKSCSICVHNTT